jgi:acid phosphatase (class A)
LKNFYPERKWPFIVEQGPLCLATTAGLANSPDYPSGHTVFGWSVGLVLGELRPDRATEILIRARAFGESRVICGVHNASAVEAGRMVAESTVAALHGNETFRGDMEAARKELGTLTRDLTQSSEPMCAAEIEMLAKRTY